MLGVVLLDITAMKHDDDDFNITNAHHLAYPSPTVMMQVYVIGVDDLQDENLVHEYYQQHSIGSFTFT
jgi:hypothetical protein